MMSTCCRMYPVWWNIFLRSANSSYSSWLLPVTKSQNLGRKLVDVIVVQKSDKNSTLGLLGTSCSPSAPSTCSRGWSSPSWPRPHDQSGDNQGLEFGLAGSDLALMEAFVQPSGFFCQTLVAYCIQLAKANSVHPPKISLKLTQSTRINWILLSRSQCPYY